MSEWRERAECLGVDPDIFYPYNSENDEPAETEENCKEAKSICFRCPVREECLEEAISTREKRGVWGGLSTRERNKIARSLVRNG